VAAGLKEALRLGTERAVAATSRPDGYLANPLIRIAVPAELDSMARALRSIGLGRQVDEFDVAMNRAAEDAATEATGVFWDAISQMTLTDAHGILKGGETAATDYFRDHTEDTLGTRFRPIISEKMADVGLARLYEHLVSSYRTLPFASEPALDLNDYVTDKALDGLFTVLGQEETRIREDPAARSTELLRRVFGD
jgi:hypothetical protein